MEVWLAPLALIVAVVAVLAWAITRQRRSSRAWAEIAGGLGLTFQPPGWIAGREPLQRIHGTLDGAEVEAVVRDRIGGRLRLVEVTARSGHAHGHEEVHFLGPKWHDAPCDRPEVARRLLGSELHPALLELLDGHDLALLVEPGLVRLRWVMPPLGADNPRRLAKALRLVAALAKRLASPPR
jgi:hypothetical protein